MRVTIKKAPKYNNRGEVPLFMANHGIQVLGDGNVAQISENNYSNPILEFKGDSHEKGGVDIAYAGQRVEVEGAETAFQDQNGDLQIMGNMVSPLHKKKFKSVFKDLAEREVKSVKTEDKGIKLLNDKNPFNPFEALSFNSGKVLVDAAKQDQKVLSQEKEDVAELQNFMLRISDISGKSPEKVSSMFEKGGTIKAKNGYSTKLNTNYDNSALRREIEVAALTYGIDQEVLGNLIHTESRGNTKAISPKGAKGVVQFMPAVAKQYGLTDKELTSSNPEDIKKVVNAGAQHFKSLLDKNNNDYALALAEYNGGQGAIDLVKKETGKDVVTGEDWIAYYTKRKQEKPTNKPSAWQNETYNYVTGILKQAPNEFGELGTHDYVSGTQPQTQEEVVPTRGQLDIKPLSTTNQAQTIPKRGVNSISQEQMETSDTTIPKGYSWGELAFDNARRFLRGNGTKDTSLAARNKLGLTDVLSDIVNLFDKPDFVQGQTFEPELYQPYQVSFQDRINQNASTFRTLAQSHQNNPSVLAVLAAQKYTADNQVMSEQFRVNQGIQNDVINKNVGIMNDAELKNIALNDQQFERQAKAKSNAKFNRQAAANNISNKVAQNRAENNNIRLIENISGYRPNQDLIMQWMGPNAFLGGNTGIPTTKGKTITTEDEYGNIVTKTIDDSTHDALFKKAKTDNLNLKKISQNITKKKFGGLM